MKNSLLFLLCLFLAYNSSAQSYPPLDGAKWISAASPFDSSGAPCPIFKKNLILRTATLRKAIFYITAHGVYEARINNSRVGQAYFAPGWTPYDKRLLYQTLDVTGLLQGAPQKNAINVTVGDGWYRGHCGTGGFKNNYGRDASLLCKLVLLYGDGTKDSLVSDDTWQVGTGPIRRSDIFFGEFQDTNIPEQDWLPVHTSLTSQINLQPQMHAPVTQQESFTPKRIFTSPKKETIIDFGQNMAGWVKLRVKGHKGDTIRVTHGEALDKDGNIYLLNLRNCDPTDIYVLKGGEVQILEPHFTYHGFRYVRVEGFRPSSENCMAIALHTDLPHSGSFSCSNPLINQLQSNIEWGLNSNLFDVPTDCPQRGERLGWTGDAQVILKTAAFNRDVQKFFEKWLYDLALEQSVNGAVARVNPDAYQFCSRGFKWDVAGWGDAATIVPMGLYDIYEDTAILEHQYASMKAWVKYELARVNPRTFIWSDFTFGDWLAMGPSTDSSFIDQSYLIHSLELFLQAVKILQVSDPDTPAFHEILEQCKRAFRRKFITSEGLLTCNTQTAYLIAIQFHLLPDSLVDRGVQRLVQLIHDNDNHLATGFLGTPFLLPVLSEYGHTDLAYTLLGQRTIPSWLYPITMGATTFWEHWDAILPNGDFSNSSPSHSLNHYAYGAVGDWLYQYVAGIRSLAPGYRRILIAPHPGGDLTWAKGAYHCRYGNILSEWKLNGKTLLMHVEIPPGIEAVIAVPGKERVTVQGGHSYYYTTLVPAG